MKPNHTKYFVPDDIVKQIRMVARFELHLEDNPNPKIAIPQIRDAIARRVLMTLVEEEKKKLLK